MTLPARFDLPETVIDDSETRDGLEEEVVLGVGVVLAAVVGFIANAEVPIPLQFLAGGEARGT